MSKLEETLRKDGWKLTPCGKLKPGDYIAVITVGGYINEGLISRTIERDSRYISVFYGDYGFEVFRAGSDDVWVVPKEYEHLEVRWAENGDMCVNVSHNPREPYFVPAFFINPERYKNIPAQAPDQLLKGKPE